MPYIHSARRSLIVANDNEPDRPPSITVEAASTVLSAHDAEQDAASADHNDKMGPHRPHPSNNHHFHGEFPVLEFPAFIANLILRSVARAALPIAANDLL